MPKKTRYLAPLVIDESLAVHRHMLVSIGDDGCVDMAPFESETARTVALTGILVSTSRNIDEIPARNSDERLSDYCDRLIGILSSLPINEAMRHVIVEAGFTIRKI